jgi:hypothetical protein
VTRTYLLSKLALLGLVAALVSLGLTACKSANETPSKSEHPAQSEHPDKPEHPK